MAREKKDQEKGCVSVEVVFQTWDHQKGPGNVFLSEKRGKEWKDYRFSWPGDKDKATAWVNQRKGENVDVYWCPMIFNTKTRKREGAMGGKVLYADLDPVDPRLLPHKPTIAWKSSNDKYQALWWLKETLLPREIEALNKNIAYSTGADKSGWDLTQMLRIPATKNHKYSPPQQGKILWIEGALYNKGTFGSTTLNNDISSAGPSLVELLSKYRTSIIPKVSRLLQYPPERITEGGRSDMLWYIENELIKAQVPLEDVARMVMLSAWNKYKGRRDEWERITTEITKIYEASSSQSSSQPPPLSLPLVTYEDMMSSLTLEPGWLIKDVWMRRSHGIIAGEPKTYKSVVSLDFAVSVASGVPLWGKYEVEEQGPVLMVQNENAEWIMRDRLEKIVSSKGLVGQAEAKGQRLQVKFAESLPLYFVNNYGYNFNDVNHREQLEEVIKQVKPVLIIFDPLCLMFDGDINSAKDLQPVLQWLINLKNNYSTSVIVVHHWNKAGTSSRGGQRMLGSTTLHGFTESAQYFQRLDDDGEGKARVVIEREFRAAGMYPKMELMIEMGEFGNPLYNPQLMDVRVASGKSELLDLISMYPAGISTNQAAKELKVSRRALTNMVEKLPEIKITDGPRSSKILKL